MLVEKEPEASFDKHLAATSRSKRQEKNIVLLYGRVLNTICFTAVTGRKSNQDVYYNQLPWPGYLPVVYEAIYIRTW